MDIDALERELPPVMLLLGPDVAGMESAVRTAVYRHGVIAADLIVTRKLTATAARSLAAYADTRPWGPFKAVIAWTDEMSEQAQNILLKVLEEPPSAIRFILLASRRPLPTIVSRCQVVTVPGAGQRPEPDGKVAAQVSAALKAAAAADLTALDAALAGWGAEHQAVLEARLTETALSGPDADERWRARRLLGVLGRFAGAHPRLAAHAALAAELSDRRQHE